MKIVLLGAGNVATHLGLRLLQTGADIRQVYSRTDLSAKELGRLLHVPHCSDTNLIDKTADIYIYTIKDSALSEVASKVQAPKAIHLHTAGSVSMNIFEGYANNYGVLYPLQTFSIAKPVDFSQIPLFLEGNNEYTISALTRLAEKLSSVHYFLSSEDRKKIHLSAVFACNFTNCMYQLAEEIVREAGVPFEVLLPLIWETADKVNYISPKEAQTGPAVRNDEQTMLTHINLLKDNENARNIYLTISEQIKELHKK
ncbi:MAG: hypothetical protein H6Q19_1024 [Bacteroidetes bacterium]|nr:hypothetical protein [Bacteroidota bacterium]